MKFFLTHLKKATYCFGFILFCFCLHAEVEKNIKNTRLIYRDDFTVSKKWRFSEGTWEYKKNGLVQNNYSVWRTNAYLQLKQNRAMMYEWEVIMTDGILDSGLHLFSSDGKAGERGDSYLVWQFKDGFVIYKTIKSRLREMIRFKGETAKNIVYINRVTYNPENGIINIYRDGKFIGSWKDDSPHKSGNFISLRTNNTRAIFRRIEVYEFNQQ